MSYRKVGYLEQCFYIIKYKIKQIWNNFKQNHNKNERNLNKNDRK